MNDKNLSKNYKRPISFDTLLFVVGILFFIFLVYLTVYSFNSNLEFAPLLLIATSILFAFIYYLFDLRKKRNATVQQILERKMNGTLDTSLAFFNGIFVVVKFLFRVALVVALVGFVIWIIIALGPFWIIAIILAFILLVLAIR